MIVALPGLFSYFFFCGISQISMADHQTMTKYTIEDSWNFPCSKLRDILKAPPASMAQLDAPSECTKRN